MKFGLDIHGVIDKCPKFFSEFTKKMHSLGHEIHILTGVRMSKRVLKELHEMDIYYDKLFSITNYLIDEGEAVEWKTPDDPWFNEEVCNKVKGDYCRKFNIDLHIDDTEEYALYFTTPILLMDKEEK